MAGKGPLGVLPITAGVLPATAGVLPATAGVLPITAHCQEKAESSTILLSCATVASMFSISTELCGKEKPKFFNFEEYEHIFL